MISLGHVLPRFGHLEIKLWLQICRSQDEITWYIWKMKDACFQLINKLVEKLNAS
jgi:hypothetical protein